MRKWSLVAVVVVAALAVMIVSGYLASALIPGALRAATPAAGRLESVELEPSSITIKMAAESVYPSGGLAGRDAEGASRGFVVYAERGRFIAYTAEVSLKVGEGEIEEVVNSILRMADTCGGYLVSMNLGKGSAHLTIRVPQSAFFEFIGEISELGDVVGKSVSGVDVSSQIIDLRARIRNAEALEARLLQLLERAEKVSEMLEVMRELSRVREEIEIMKAQLENLERSVAYSTVFIWIFEEAAKEHVEIIFKALDSEDNPVPNAHIYVKGDEMVRLVTDEFGEAEASFERWQNLSIMATFYRADGEILKATLGEFADSNKTVTIKFDKSSKPPAINFDQVSNAALVLANYLLMGLMALAILAAPLTLATIALIIIARKMYARMKRG